MNENTENIDSENMRVLSEFRSKGETENNEAAFRLGVLGSNFIIATKSKRGETTDANIIPTDEEINMEFDEDFADEYATEAERNAARNEMRENTKKFYENSIRRGWWNGDILFEKSNLKSVYDTLTKVLAGKLVESGERSIKIKQGKDYLGIGAISNWGHSMPAPEDRVTLQNLRKVVLDGIEMGKVSLNVNVPTAKKLNEEIGKILKNGNF